jgi:hypothetical protein
MCAVIVSSLNVLWYNVKSCTTVNVLIMRFNV